jgi:choline dehydrogenase-like flavoprotein
VFHKQICLTDFYEDLRAKYKTSVGTIQDIYTPSAEVLRHFAPKRFKQIVSLSSRFLQNLLCIAEDEPQERNGVTLSKEKDALGMELVQVQHRYSFADYERRDLLIDRAKDVLGKAGGLIKRSYEIDSFSHAVGSVRFGDDSEQSALDRNCRLRGLENLFVVDGSFMPTSGGVNPSLTIAANALRVGKHIHGEFSRSPGN